jgi:chaperone modulatory protein CbpM
MNGNGPMIGIEVVVRQVAGLKRPDLERWIDNAWVRPDGPAGHYAFREIDVARVLLIKQLRDEMEVNERALPVVLSLLDQLYDMRRRMRAFGDAVCHTAPYEVRRDLAAQLGQHPP